MIDLSGARRTPFAHQVVGIEWLVDQVRPDEGRVLPGCLLLADEMRLGKTKQVIDAATVLAHRGEILKVIVVAPAPVRDVWFDHELGELQKHMWLDTEGQVVEYHSTIRGWSADAGSVKMYWIVTNYEYIRWKLRRTSKGWTGPHLDPLLDRAGKDTLLVCDESSALVDTRSLQTRAVMAIRRRCGRIWQLNGSPVSESPEELFAQAFVLDPRILGCGTKTEFLRRYAVQRALRVEVKTKWGTYSPKVVVGWFHSYKPGCCTSPELSAVHAWDGMADLQKRMAPYVLRRERKDCLDLPPKLEPVALSAKLTKTTWKLYTELRDEFIAWLDEQTVVNPAQAGVRAMRLEQLCGGFLGGAHSLEAEACPRCGGNGDDPESDGPCGECEGLGGVGSAVHDVRQVSSEKMDVLHHWVLGRLNVEPEMRMLLWCRFRPEMFGVAELLEKLHVPHRLIYGGQYKSERRAGLELMHPDTPPYAGPAVLVGTLGTGAMGLNMAGAHEVLYYSNDWRRLKRVQSEDRPHGPGQTQAISYHDIVAVGPNGQRTADHNIIHALRNKEDLAKRTVDGWKRLLAE